jgi:ribonucleotide monophosphatase NagD (HAD superfamily)
MGKLSDKKGYICDMDGVIYHGNKLVDGAKEFVDWLKSNEKRFLFLTNSSAKSPKVLRRSLHAWESTWESKISSHPLIMRHAINRINCQREETLIVGDRMDSRHRIRHRDGTGSERHYQAGRPGKTSVSTKLYL